MEIDESDMIEDATIRLRDDMINNLTSNESIVFKSQQRGEPDLTTEEKGKIALECLEKSRTLFLSRFGDYLLEHHLKYFENGDPEERYEVDFYLSDIRKKCSTRKNKVNVRNRRFEAMKRLASDTDYFSEGEMKKRKPLLYDHLVGQYLTQDERNERESFANFRCSEEESSGYKLSTLLMEQWEREQADNLRKQQQENEEEFDDSDSAEEESYFNLWGESQCKENRRKIRKESESNLTHEEKRILMQEFQSHAFASFLAGDDSQFDYTTVDHNTAYDNMDAINRDEEEKYFDSDSHDAIDTTMNAISQDQADNSENMVLSGLMCDEDSLEKDVSEQCKSIEANISRVKINDSQISVDNDHLNGKKGGCPKDSSHSSDPVCSVQRNSSLSEESSALDPLDTYMKSVAQTCAQEEIDSKMKCLMK